MKFKIDDKVRIIDDGRKSRIGLVGTIEKIDDKFGPPYRVVFEDGNFTWKCEDNIELVEASESDAKKDEVDIANETITELKKIDFHGHPGFYKLLIKMADLHSRKNHDYAGEGNPLRNFYKCEEQGLEAWRGIMVRLSDKWSRLESFCRQGELEVKNESVVDTLMDNAVYSLLAILLFEEKNK
jgi:hypothetical protein